MGNSHKILGLNVEATLEEVEEKYNELLKEFNPEKQEKDMKEFFQKEQDKVKEAYKEISLNFPNKKEEEEVIFKEVDEIDQEIEDIDKYYKILGVTQDSSLAEINQKYNQLLDEFNPDHQSDSLRGFFKKEQEKVKNAYDKITENLADKIDILKTPIEEVEYDGDDLGEYQGSEKTKFCKFCGHMQYETNTECVNCSESLISIGYKSTKKEIIKTGEYKSMFSSPFSFTGRIRRLEYSISLIIFCIVVVLTMELLEKRGVGEMFVFIFIFPSLWFLLAQGTKRCHDYGNSGWLQLIPYYNPFALIFASGNIGDNEYGSNPKGLNSN